MPVPKAPLKQNALPAPEKSRIVVNKIIASPALVRMRSILAIVRGVAPAIPAAVRVLFPVLHYLALSA